MLSCRVMRFAIAVVVVVVAAACQPVHAKPTDTVVIEVDAPAGSDAAAVERTIVVPIENALSSLPGLAQMTSTSTPQRARVRVAVDGPADAALHRIREA